MISSNRSVIVTNKKLIAAGGLLFCGGGWCFLRSLLWLHIIAFHGAVAMSSTSRRIQCTLCQQEDHHLCFESRNLLFDHLRHEHGYERQSGRQHQDDDDNEGLTSRDRTAASIAARSTYKNPHHDAYYRLQCQQKQAGIMTLEEWELTQEYFRKPLTMAFRISSSSTISSDHAAGGGGGGGGGPRREYWKWLEKEAGDYLVQSPYISSCRMARIPLREWSTTAQQALSDAQELGVINRQELCSMIPPLLLLSNWNISNKQAAPGQKTRNPRTVLDLCAAPGSKTLQLLDLVASKSEEDDGGNGSSSKKKRPPFQGMVIANDANRSRLLTVARRARILGQASNGSSSSKTSLVLNSSDGRHFPALRKWAGYKLKFDHVLADVPCSGDGTLRKSSSKEWKQWNVKQHLTLHKLQVGLLLRSLELVKKGGRVVYSTCSLDPIENEAVVASAILKMGGPGVYRIIKPPEYLQITEGSSLCSSSSLEPFVYTSGASSWVVPHPQFDAYENPTVYNHYEQVPKKLAKRDILPSMFPPSNQQHENNIMMKDMLSNCCRILPQHLDSGGFFCAIIERVPPEYFAVCCPSQRESNNTCSATEDDYDASHHHHGRIYHLVANDDDDDDHARMPNTTSISQTKQMRIMLRADTAGNKTNEEDSMDYYFEGLPTLEAAQQWLRQHSAFVPGKSESAVDFPSISLPLLSQPPKQWYSKEKFDKKSDDNTRTNQERPMTTSPLYTPLVSPPHPDLVTEFVDFFGLSTTAQEAQLKAVHRFPVEQLVAIGGGEQASQVTTNRMGMTTDESSSNNNTNNNTNDISKTDNHDTPRKRSKYLQLTLVSEEIRSLFTGGARFNPMELGLALCRVPVGSINTAPSMGQDENDSMLSRTEKSGRYGLLDEAAEFLGPCATKRLLPLSLDDGVELLRSGRLDCIGSRFQEIFSKMPAPGAIIAVCPISKTEKTEHGDASHTPAVIYLSCVLQEAGADSIRLLTERRSADAWLGLLSKSQSKTLD